MALSLYNYNIVRVREGQQIIHCTIIKMHYDSVQIKLHGKLYRVPYGLIDQVVGHELLVTEPA